MNDRERFIATMHYKETDRSPIYDFSFWVETLPEWHKQGLPKSVNISNAADYFGVDASLFSGAGDKHFVDVNFGLCPGFGSKVIEDRGDHEVVQQDDGVRVLRKKVMGSIPMHEGHLLVDRDSWEKHYKPRLDPDNAERYPKNWDEHVAVWKDPDRDYPLFIHGGMSLYGVLRNWMGLEGVSMVVYDDPVWLGEMIERLADCVIGGLKRVLGTGAKFEACGIWEDICYNAGPLIGPSHFKQYLVPQYKRITELLRSHGVDVIWVDCDGKIDDLLPLFLDSGVNCMFPMEIGTWGADPVKYRKQYGKDLLIMGGFDKHLLARTKAQIEAEVIRLAPLVSEGGYIGFCDHRVPPDVPLENYIFYLEKVREIWGKGVNLKPMSRDI